MADGWGDLKGGADGLFDHDTRLLSRLVMTVGGARPSRLSSGVSQDNVFFTCHSTNRPLPPMGGRSAPAGVLHIERRRFVWDRRMFERVRMVNHGIEDVLLPLAFEFGADFADIFQVRGTPAATGAARIDAADARRAARDLPLSRPGRRRAHQLPGLFRAAGPADAPAAPSSCSACPRASGSDLYRRMRRRTPARRPTQTRWRLNAVAGPAGHADAGAVAGPRCAGPRSPRFNDWLDQSRADVALLTTDLPTGPYPYAGVPWFSTPFGRDGIITAWQMLWLDPSLAKGVLTYLAKRQATETSAFRTAQPGKIMHETRGGEMSALGEVPFGLYYGGVDTTCLFVALAGAYATRTGDLELIRDPVAQSDRRHRMDDATMATANGDGLIDYQRAAETGLSNQGWKDSEDFDLPHRRALPQGADRPAGGPGLCLRRLAGDGRSGAARWATPDAAALGRPGRDGPQPGRGPVLDGGSRASTPSPWTATARPCRSIGSNAGHLLFTGLPSRERALSGGRSACCPADFRSGWGLRTLAQGPGAVQSDELSQRLGLAARHGAWRRPAWPATASAGAWPCCWAKSMRPPAISRCACPNCSAASSARPGEPPIAYPVACLPQAWAAGSVFLMLQAALGVRIDAFAGTVEIDNPVLPVGIDRL